MSAVEAQRRAAAETAIIARDPLGRIVRRVAIGYLIALVAAPPITFGVMAPAIAEGLFNGPEAPAEQVVEAQCLNGRIQQGIDTDRADGLLLAHDTGVNC